MKAINTKRSMRNHISNSSEHTLGVNRSKSPMDDTLSLLYNMNDCYNMLKELVPSLPQNKNVSKIEILQHVIDYILDLQIALDSSSNVSSCQYHPRRLGHAASPRNPLATINTDINLLTFQTIGCSRE
uniref:DNA-binding protein inhibitor ID-4 n=1 Tax=Esox lucius TaxID=8010 RepID=A0A3P8Y7K5_ESOLU